MAYHIRSCGTYYRGRATIKDGGNNANVHGWDSYATQAEAIAALTGGGDLELTNFAWIDDKRFGYGDFAYQIVAGENPRKGPRPSHDDIRRMRARNDACDAADARINGGLAVSDDPHDLRGTACDRNERHYPDGA